MSALTTPSGSREKDISIRLVSAMRAGEGDMEKLKSDRLARHTQGHLEVHQLNRQEQDKSSECEQIQ